jgi:WD40 repeat protein
MPLWSPDGRWLAFSRALGGSGTSEFVGLHILDLICNGGLAKCWHDEVGIPGPGGLFYYSWSPNGEFLAVVDHTDTVSIFQIKTGKLSLVKTYKVGGSLNQVAWLGNNNELFVLDYDDPGDGHIISRQTGMVSPISEAQSNFFRSPGNAFMSILNIP